MFRAGNNFDCVFPKFGCIFLTRMASIKPLPDDGGWHNLTGGLQKGRALATAGVFRFCLQKKYREMICFMVFFGS